MSIDVLGSTTSHPPFASLRPLRRRALLVLTGSLASAPLWAQFRVEVSGVGMTQVPIAIASFRGEAQAPQKTGVIVRANMERSGMFRAVDTVGVIADESTKPDLALWRQKGADAMVAGSITPLADGRFEVRARLWDVVRGQDMGVQSYVVIAADLRLCAHRISDFVYEKLTGEKGIFSTRITYVTKTDSRYTLWVADSDGENGQAALASAEPIISPTWSPNGAQLAYVSFESRKPVIYTHEVATGKRRLLANFRGSNSAPAWSPDGRQVVATLSREGGSQLYALETRSGDPQRLTQSSSIDTEPAFSADGKSIYFVSDRGGAPQIYRMDATGGTAERVTFTGSYNISPAVSPDGRWLAYISRVSGAFKLQVMELASGNAASVTDTVNDESPSFAPNSRLIVYATRQGGREVLVTTTLDGKTKVKLTSAIGDVREPDWGPYQR